MQIKEHRLKSAAHQRHVHEHEQEVEGQDKVIQSRKDYLSRVQSKLGKIQEAAW